MRRPQLFFIAIVILIGAFVVVSGRFVGFRNVPEYRFVSEFVLESSTPDSAQVLPIHQEIKSIAPDISLLTIGIVSNLEGNVEGCACTQERVEGGLLTTLYRLNQIYTNVTRFIVVDGGGNFRRSDGLLDGSDLPESFSKILESLFDGSHCSESGILQFHDFVIRLPRLPIDTRNGKNVATLTLHYDAESHFSQQVAPQLYVNNTAIVQSALARFRRGDIDTYAARRFFEESLNDGFVVEAVSVVGNPWIDDQRLVDVRQDMLLEFFSLHDFALRRTDSATCSSCHKSEYEGWISMGTHSNAFEKLGAVQSAQRNPFCVACHTTGMKADEFVGQPLLVPAKIRNVQCRSCHDDSPIETSCVKNVGRPMFSTCSSCHTEARLGSLAGAQSLRDVHHLIGCLSGTHD